MIDKNTGNNNRRTFWYTDAYFACLTTVSGGKNDDLPDPGAWPCCCCVLRTPRSIFWDAYGRSSTRFSTIRHIYAFIKVKAFQPWDHTFSCIHFWTCFMCLSCSLFVREKAPPVWWYMVCGGLYLCYGIFSGGRGRSVWKIFASIVDTCLHNSTRRNGCVILWYTYIYQGKKTSFVEMHCVNMHMIR